ncbi:MAG: DUF3795 domain-containing protein [Breznakibacter sp.]
MNENLVSYCGLYCANCRKFQNKKCPGCQENVKASWCKIRTCCQNNQYTTCADCTEKEASTCSHYNNGISKFFEIVFRSDRKSSVAYIKAHGRAAFTQLMVDQNRMVIKKQRGN